jgi:hypothetical protein
MSFWLGLVAGIPIMYDILGLEAVPMCLLAAPVFNLLLDLSVRALLKVNEEPQQYPETKSYTTTCGTSSITVSLKN